MKDKAKKKVCPFLCFKKNFSEFYKRNKRLLLTVFCICIVLVLIAAMLFTIIIPKYNYDKARDFISSGKYAEAYERLIASGDYENAEEMKKDFLWVPGKTVSTYSGTTGVYSTVNEYDENGNCIMQITTNPDYEQSITESTFDKKGNLIKQVASGKSGEVNETVTNKYDKNGNLIKKTSVKSDGTTETVTYKLNKNGIVEKEIITDNNGNTSETVYSDYKVFYKN